jgi:hypothetical protein
MYAMCYADLVDSEGAVVTLVARRPADVASSTQKWLVYAFFVGVEDVKFAFMANSGCCKGGGCPALPPDSLGGLGRTIMEWVLAMGCCFLERRCSGMSRSPATRDIRNRVRGWVF